MPTTANSRLLAITILAASIRILLNPIPTPFNLKLSLKVLSTLNAPSSKDSSPPNQRKLPPSKGISMTSITLALKRRKNLKRRFVNTTRLLRSSLKPVVSLNHSLKEASSKNLPRSPSRRMDSSSSRSTSMMDNTACTSSSTERVMPPSSRSSPPSPMAPKLLLTKLVSRGTTDDVAQNH